jgi:hypothetical protein
MSDEPNNQAAVENEYVRDLVLSRLQLLSPDTMKMIGGQGPFSRNDLIRHVTAGDEVGKIIEEVEVEWMRAQGGLLDELAETL